LGRTDDDSRERLAFGGPLCQQRDVAFDLALLRLGAKRQFAHFGLERADLTLLRGGLALKPLDLRAQAEHLFGLGLHLS
jgi:hypothetical protein